MALVTTAETDLESQGFGRVGFNLCCFGLNELDLLPHLSFVFKCLFVCALYVCGREGGREGRPWHVEVRGCESFPSTLFEAVSHCHCMPS